MHGDTIVVGATGAAVDGKAKAGKAFLFSTDGSLIAKIVAPDAAADDQFGAAHPRSLAVSRAGNSRAMAFR